MPGPAGRVHPNMGPPGMLPAGMHTGVGRGMAMRGGMSPRGLAASRRPLTTAQGGRLEIAGVVVGSWGPNYGLTPINVGRSVMVQPQVSRFYCVDFFIYFVFLENSFACLHFLVNLIFGSDFKAIPLTNLYEKHVLDIFTLKI